MITKMSHATVWVRNQQEALEFYRDKLGFRVAGESENYGVEQEHLNQVFGARLRITGLRAASGPGIEFLEYITPPGGRALPAGAKANDLVFWNTHLITRGAQVVVGNLKSQGIMFVSKGTAGPQIVRDPDGHALEIDADASVQANR